LDYILLMLLETLKKIRR